MVPCCCAEPHTVCVTVSSRHLASSTRPLVLGHWRNQWRVVSGQRVCSLPAFIRVPRMWTPSWWRDTGRRVQVNGGSLSLVQNGIFHFITDPNSRMIASQPRWNVSAIQRARRTSETTVNPPGSPNRVRPEYDPSLINMILQLICIFGFPVRGRAARHRWCMEETPQIEKLYSRCYLCPPSFHYTSVSIISSVNVQSLCTSPHDGVDCNCLQMHWKKETTNSWRRIRSEA